MLNEVAVRAHGIDRDDHALQLQRFERHRYRAQLVGSLSAGFLPQHQLGFGREGAHQGQGRQHAAKACASDNRSPGAPCFSVVMSYLKKTEN